MEKDKGTSMGWNSAYPLPPVPPNPTAVCHFGTGALLQLQTLQIQFPLCRAAEDIGSTGNPASIVAAGIGNLLQGDSQDELGQEQNHTQQAQAPGMV